MRNNKSEDDSGVWFYVRGMEVTDRRCVQFLTSTATARIMGKSHTLTGFLLELLFSLKFG